MQHEALDLSTDERQKRRVARRAMTGTPSGCFMAALTVVLAAATVACPIVVGGWLESGGAAGIGLTDAEGLEWGLTLFFLAMTIMCLGIWFRQRNRRCALRHEEHLTLNGSQLVYRYKEELGLANARAEGVGEGRAKPGTPSAARSGADKEDWLDTEFQRTVYVDLAQVHISYDEALAEWVFEGEIHGVDFARPEGYEIQKFQLGDYFGSELEQVLRSHMNGVK